MELRRPHALPSVMAGLDGPSGRMAVFSTSTGRVVRYLTPASDVWDEGNPTLTPDRRSILFIRDSTITAVLRPRVWGTFRVAVTGGRVTKYKAAEEGGALPFASGKNGAYAGATGGVATVELIARNARGHMAYIIGTRDFPADSQAWAPDGIHLAIGLVKTYRSHAQIRIVDTRTARDLVGDGVKVPCPKSIPSCGLRAAGYGPDGSLYSVALTRSAGRSFLVRRAPGARVPVVVTKLPGAARNYGLFVAPSGAVLVWAETWTQKTTASEFVVAWDGARLRSLPKRIMEPAW